MGKVYIKQVASCHCSNGCLTSEEIPGSDVNRVSLVTQLEGLGASGISA